MINHDWVSQRRLSRGLVLPKSGSKTLASLARLWSVTPGQVLDGLRHYLASQGILERLEGEKQEVQVDTQKELFTK